MVDIWTTTQSDAKEVVEMAQPETRRAPIMFISPPKYVQGPGVLDDLHVYVGDLGSRATVIADQTVWGLFGERIARSAEKGKLEADPFIFSGECSFGEIERATARASDTQSDVIIGVGGGKASDTAKSVGARLGRRWATLATIASTDAPTSSISVIYTDEGDFASYEFHGKNPDLVLVDSEAVAQAPARFLASGMADAVSTRWESAAAAASGTIAVSGGRPSNAGLALGALAWENCKEHGVSALRAAEVGVVTPALEIIVETNTFHSGVGFESGGFSGAHSVHNGLTVLPQTHSAMHGEKVNFGILCQLVLENRPDFELDEFIEFSLPLGLPVTLEGIGAEDLSDEDLHKVAETTVAEGESIHWMPFPVTAEMVAGAILGSDAYAKGYIGERELHPRGQRLATQP
jgi:glycerol dehydrogenase